MQQATLLSLRTSSMTLTSSSSTCTKILVFNPIEKCIKLHTNVSARDEQVFQCIVHVLFEETRSLSEYPFRELSLAAQLMGGLVAHNLLTTQKLQMALRIVLQSLVKPIDAKVFEYGVVALGIFKHRLPEWPQFGKQVRQVADIEMRLPGIMSIINNAAAATPTTAGAVGSLSAAPTGAAAPGGTPSSPSEPNSGFLLHAHDIRVLMGPQRAQPVVAPQDDHPGPNQLPRGEHRSHKSG